MEIQYWLVTYESLIDENNTPRVSACEFVNRLIQAGAPFLILTRGLDKTKEQIATTLQELGFHEVREEHIYTEVDVAASYCLTHYPGKHTAGYLGSKSMKYTLLEHGFVLTQEKADFFFVGSDHQSGYSDYDYAFRILENGARLICCDRRAVEVVSGRKSIGAGAITTMLEYASGQDAFDCCYPGTVMITEPLKHLDARIPRSVFISTDFDREIIPASSLGLKTIWINDGSEEVNVFDASHHPDYVIEDFAGLMGIFE